MKKVLVSDALSDRGLDILRKSGKIEVFEKPKITAEELLKEIGQYDALVVRSRTKVTKDVLAAAKNLKVIGRAGSGVDNIDVTESTRRGVVVMNTPGGNTVTTAEHTVSMMMALARQIPQAHSSTKAGKWERGKFMGVELTGKTLGIIGTGNIGTVVADRAQGLKMSVIAYDPYVTAEIARKRGFEKVELDELYARADFISIHTPLLDSTKNLVNAQAFAKMKDGVRLINCARGGLVNEKDLYDAIQSGKVAGAALDVFE
ncbi:MAG: phosphoglycerate dehydrogenase, partial [Myxococcales bacterium]|nr:phosphoglycerate dehydrogenase [Myxococcales bacterium]